MRALVFAGVAFVCASCDGDVAPAARFAPTAATRAYCRGHDDDAVEARIDALLTQLTLDEKAALMHGASIAAIDHAWTASGVARLGVSDLRMLDGPRGVSVTSGQQATAFPVPMMRGATWDTALERRVGAAIAEEARVVGVDVLLAPTLNLLRHPRWGRAQETYSEDTRHLGAMAAAFIEGVQSVGVMACAKHLAANSIENTRHTVDVRLDARTLREQYLPHFRRAVVDAHVATVMTAYNRVNGAWADQSAPLLTDVLKGEWGFAGVVMSDWVFGTHGDAESVRAGLDLEMPSGLRFRALPNAARDGRLTVRELDASVRRLLRARLCFTPPPGDPRRLRSAEHLALAREVARRGIVLLRNEEVGASPALPFGGDVRRVVVLGRNADVENLGDRGSSNVMAGDAVTAWEAIRARPGVEATRIEGDTLDAAAMDAVRAADAVVVVTGNDARDEGEGELGAGDRRGLDLHDREAALVRAVTALHRRVVVVLEGGAAITPNGWSEGVAAVVFAFYPGVEGGDALAEILFGDASPSGRLPFSVPVRESDLPPFDNTSDVVTYGYLHGYGHLAAMGTAPAWPFGHGLSYTRFAWSDLLLSSATLRAGETLHATVTVRNTGSVRGIETVQVYVGASPSRVQRAPRDLRAFAQVELAPGEARAVTLALPADDLRYWDVDANAWALERTTYRVTAAPDAAATGLSATVRVE